MEAMQKTIKKEVSYSGICLHTGAYTTITFKPAPAGSGVVFIRKDMPGSPQIKASVENVVAVTRGTTLGVGDAKVPHRAGEQVMIGRLEMLDEGLDLLPGALMAFVKH